ncbi:MAG TPA: hypothetical protein VF753_07655 [Terriglobales bacterium]
MKSNRNVPLKFVLATAIVLAISASAFGSCGDAMRSLAASAAVGNRASSSRDNAGVSEAAPDGASAVGLWHVFFSVGGNTIQEAYQTWNLGGTEIHNPNVDPRAGNVCLGAWEQLSGGSYKLTHRVWNYDTNGNLLGTIHLHEVITLSSNGNGHHGAFRLDFYDPSGKFVTEVKGEVKAARIEIE